RRGDRFIVGGRRRALVDSSPPPHAGDARHRLHPVVGDRRPPGSRGRLGRRRRRRHRVPPGGDGGGFSSRLREWPRAGRPFLPLEPEVGETRNVMDPILDLLVVGAGPTAIAIGAEARQQGLSVLLVDRGPLTSAIQGYPTFMEFFTTRDRLEIAGVPF